MIIHLPIAFHALPMGMLTSLSVDEILNLHFDIGSLAGVLRKISFSERPHTHTQDKNQ